MNEIIESENNFSLFDTDKEDKKSLNARSRNVYYFLVSAKLFLRHRIEVDLKLIVRSGEVTVPNSDGSIGPDRIHCQSPHVQYHRRHPSYCTETNRRPTKRVKRLPARHGGGNCVEMNNSVRPLPQDTSHIKNKSYEALLL